MIGTNPSSFTGDDLPVENISYLEALEFATFLEQYDLSGKTILPFCSHGGGRFGQSLTAIAKLAPNSDIGEGLSVHYSGGNTLSDDVAAWLQANGMK